MGAEADALCGAALGRADPGAGQPAQRLPRAPPGTRGWARSGAGDPEAAGGQLLPGLAAGAAPAGRAGAGGGGRRVLRARGLDPPGRGPGADARDPGLSKSQVSGWPAASTARWRRSGPGRWTPAPTPTCGWTRCGQVPRGRADREWRCGRHRRQRRRLPRGPRRRRASPPRTAPAGRRSCARWSPAACRGASW